MSATTYGMWSRGTCIRLQALGPGFTQYAEPVFVRCINLIRTHEVAKVGGNALRSFIVESMTGCVCSARFAFGWMFFNSLLR